MNFNDFITNIDEDTLKQNDLNNKIKHKVIDLIDLYTKTEEYSYLLIASSLLLLLADEEAEEITSFSYSIASYESFRIFSNLKEE